MPRLIAVGVDGSRASLFALDWAVETAAARGVPVVAVIAKPVTRTRGREPVGTDEQRDRAADEHASRIRLDVEHRTQGAAVTIEERQGGPVEVMLAMSASADLLVVGARPHRNWRGVLNTPIADQLAAHTRVPLCIVPDRPGPKLGRILVALAAGGNDATISFAADEAHRRDAAVRVLSTWQYPRDTTATSPELAGLLEHGARAAAAEAVGQMRRRQPTVAVDSVVRFGPAVAELAALAGPADLVVVGTHGRRGGFGSLLTGSSPANVLHRVGTPVIVVPQ